MVWQIVIAIVIYSHHAGYISKRQIGISNDLVIMQRQMVRSGPLHWTVMPSTTNATSILGPPTTCTTVSFPFRSGSLNFTRLSSYDKASNSVTSVSHAKERLRYFLKLHGTSCQSRESNTYEIQRGMVGTYWIRIRHKAKSTAGFGLSIEHDNGVLQFPKLGEEGMEFGLSD